MTSQCFVIKSKALQMAQKALHDLASVWYPTDTPVLPLLCACSGRVHLKYHFQGEHSPDHKSDSCFYFLPPLTAICKIPLFISLLTYWHLWREAPERQGANHFYRALDWWTHTHVLSISLKISLPLSLFPAYTVSLAPESESFSTTSLMITTEQGTWLIVGGLWMLEE